MPPHPLPIATTTAAAPEHLGSAPQALALVAAEMLQVDAVIQRRLASDVVMINQIAHYIISAGGKRDRKSVV